jgi:hypothetical protein
MGRPRSPDHADNLALKARGLSHTRGSLTIARKLARRSFHVLHELGPAALDPVTTTTNLKARFVTPALRHGSHASGQLPQLSRLPPPSRWRPTKTERPESLHPD